MPEKINVIIATNILDIGGAERTVQTIALYADKSKFNISVLCMLRGGPRVQLLQESGIPVLIGDGTIEKVKELIPKPNVDILHFHRSGQNELSIHLATVEYLKPKKLMETNIFAFSDPVLGPKFDLQAFKSKMMLSERAWKDVEPTEQTCLKQRVIYNPVTLDYFERFRITSAERELMRDKLGIKPDDIVIGRVGRDDTVKWGDLILSALPYILKSDGKIKVLFRTLPKNRIPWMKRHKFFDERVIVLPESSSEKEIAETYQIMDICVHTSRRGEAFGNSLNEAMAWSLPIVVENTPHWDNGQLEQVVNGQTGWVVSSVGGLTAAISKLATDLEMRRNFGQAGRKWVEGCFGFKRGVRQYELAYEFLAGVVSPAEALKQMYPSSEELLKYREQYKKLAALDYPHGFRPCREAKRKLQYWRWRVLDSLVSRGHIKIKV